MPWNAAYTIRNAAVAQFTSSAFGIILSTVNGSAGTSAPQIADDPRTTSGVAVYTVPRTTYVFPCVEVMPPEGMVIEHSKGSTTSELDLWVIVSYRGSEEQLDAWALTYLTALVRCFSTDTSASGFIWSPAEVTASPVGQTNIDGTFVQAVGIRLHAEIAESIA